MSETVNEKLKRREKEVEDGVEPGTYLNDKPEKKFTIPDEVEDEETKDDEINPGCENESCSCKDGDSDCECQCRECAGEEPEDENPETDEKKQTKKTKPKKEGNARTEAFTKTIKDHLDGKAEQDEVFAKAYAKPDKNLDECIAFIFASVEKLSKKFEGNAVGLDDSDVFEMAEEYYERDKVDVKKHTSMNVVVNHRIELTPEEKEKARKDAIKTAHDQELERLTTKKKKTAVKKVKTTIPDDDEKPKKSQKKKEKAPEVTAGEQTSLF